MAGRPTKYEERYATDEYKEEFLKHCADLNETVTICGLAVYLKVTEQTLHNWADKNSEFLGTIEQIKQISKQQLFQGGLNKSLSSRIVKLGLSANHGMSEKNITEMQGLEAIQPVITVTLTGQDGKSIPNS